MLSERELLDRARAMRRNPGEWEKLLWRRLSDSQIGYKFRRQAVISSYICDFFCPSKGLIVEVDGDMHDPVADGRRDATLLDRGFRTLRFSNSDVRDNMEGVVLTIVNALRSRPDRWSGPHPNPSPEGEGLAS